MAQLLTLLAVLLVPLTALAQADQVTYGDAITELVQLAQSLKGAGGLAIAVAACQAAMIALRTPLATKLGKWQITAVTALSVAASLLGVKMLGGSWGAALVAGPVLAAAQVFAHQLYSQFTEAAPAAPSATTPAPKA